MEGRSFRNSGVEFWNAKGKDATSVVRERVQVGRVLRFADCN
jgi:hypothetical protein